MTAVLCVRKLERWESKSIVREVAEAGHWAVFSLSNVTNYHRYSKVQVLQGVRETD